MRALTVDAVDRTDVVRLPGTTLVSAAYNGEPGTGSVTVDDEAAALTFPALKIVRWTEDASGATKHLYRGRLIRKALSRGGFVADDSRQYLLDVSDSNWDLHRLRVHQWVRPEETGRARVVALGAYILNGSSSTVTNARKRPSTVIDVTTYVPNTNTITMPARTYDATDPWSVIDDCARAEGKRFFVFINDAGAMFLWYDDPISTSYASTLSITDVAPDLVTEFPPAPDGSPGEEDGAELLSGAGLVDSTGTAYNEFRSGIETAHDVAEETIYDDGAGLVDATNRLTALLDDRELEELRYSCAVQLPDDKAHLIKAGMTISFRWAAAGVTSPVTLRVARCAPELIEPDLYLLHLELGFPKKIAGRIQDHGRGVIVGSQNGPCVPHCNETFTRTVASGLGMSEFCPVWQQDTITADPMVVSVGGGEARFEADPGNSAQAYHWVDVWQGATLPVEVLWTGLRIKWTDNSDTLDVVLQMDGQPDPPGSTFWCYVGFDPDVDDLGVNVQTSEGGADSAVFGTFPSQDVTLNVRVRLEASAVRTRIWQTGFSEPSAWLLVDAVTDESPINGQLHSLGLYLSDIKDEGAGDESLVQLDGIAITAGCNAAAGLQESIAQASSFVSASKWSLE